MKFSGEALLAIGGMLMFATFAGVFLLPTLPGVVGHQSTTYSAFELGEYYFNHDSDQGGAYDLSMAKLYYLQAISEEPDNPFAIYQYGRILFIEGDFNGALKAFAFLERRFDDRIPNMYYMLGLVYGYKAREHGDTLDWERAEASFEKFIPYAPQSPWPRVDLAWVYFAQGKFEEMIPIVEEGLLHRPNNPWLLNMYGLALFNQGEIDQAREIFTQALEAAKLLTEEDWGKSYPGNDPAVWGQGLASFKELIAKNVALTQ